MTEENNANLPIELEINSSRNSVREITQTEGYCGEPWEQISWRDTANRRIKTLFSINVFPEVWKKYISIQFEIYSCSQNGSYQSMLLNHSNTEYEQKLKISVYFSLYATYIKLLLKAHMYSFTIDAYSSRCKAHISSDILLQSQFMNAIRNKLHRARYQISAYDATRLSFSGVCTLCRNVKFLLTSNLITDIWSWWMTHKRDRSWLFAKIFCRIESSSLSESYLSHVAVVVGRKKPHHCALQYTRLRFFYVSLRLLA